MFSEFKKSFDSVLQERVSSPFYGALIFSWIVWNWKIIYLTLFVSENNIAGNKIDFIGKNYSDVENLIIFPLISAFIILTIIPFLSNAAFWLDLKFTQWKIVEKQKVEGKQLLSLEQSIALRKELREKEKEFDDLLQKKDLEINILKGQIVEFEKSNTSKPNNNYVELDSGPLSENSYGSKEFENFKKNKMVFHTFEEVAKSINEYKNFPEGLPEHIKEYYLINEIVDKKLQPHGFEVFELTFKGNKLYKDYFNHKFEQLTHNQQLT